MAAKKKSASNDGRLPTVAEKRRVIGALKAALKATEELELRVKQVKKDLEDLDFSGGG